MITADTYRAFRAAEFEALHTGPFNWSGKELNVAPLADQIASAPLRHKGAGPAGGAALRSALIDIALAGAGKW